MNLNTPKQETQKTSAKRLFSYLIQGIISLFFLMGVVSNILKTEVAIRNSQYFGYDESSLIPLALLLMLATILYLIPRSSILGAMLLTGWLGGAIATHIIHGDGIMVIMIPIIFGLLTWYAIWLRNDLFYLSRKKQF